MKHAAGLLLLFCLCSPRISAQTGKRNQQYWQQRVDTKLEVTLDDQKHFLRGRETFTYTNNSPDTLREIFIHLYPNAYSSDRTAFCRQQVLQGKTGFYFSKPAQRGYIDSLDFIIDGAEAAYLTTELNPDVARIELPEPLTPGKTMKVETPFRVKIPAVWSRMGHTGQAYYISQWFPKPAVYDRKGWHPMPYLDQGEFYSEIGSYEVSVTLPKNYVVMATGNCVTPSEAAWMDSIALRLPVDRLLTRTVARKGQPARDSFPSSPELKTIRFSEDNIHDFAFFADKRYTLRKDTIVLDGGRDTVMAWAAYFGKYDNKNWLSSTSYLKQTVLYLSRHVGPYPYKTIKVAEGDLVAGGGMEYPTIAVIAKSSRGSATVIVHEAGHNWFQGILATNERDHPWMDEGVNSFYERKIIEQIEGRENADDSYRTQEDLYYQQVRNGLDQPMETTSAELTEINYPVDAYIKPALFLRWLEAAMDSARFEAAMKTYFKQWKHRHPYPEDMQASFRQGKDSTDAVYGFEWFIEKAIHEDRLIDQKARDIDTLGELFSPGLHFPLLDGHNYPVIFESDSHKHLSISPVVPDANPTNNGNGGLAVRFGFGTTRSGKQRIFLLPALGYNVYDGFMLGGLIHNLSFPESKFRYLLAPVYSFGAKELVGGGSLGLFLHPRGAIQELAIQLDGKSFHYFKTDFDPRGTVRARYTKLAPSLTFTFRKPYPNHTATRTLQLKGYAINEQDLNFTIGSSGEKSAAPVPGVWRGFGRIRYSHRNERTFNPFSYTAEVQGSSSFVKLSLEATARIDYNVKNKGLHLRAFLGKFLGLDGSDAYLSRYYLNAAVTGPYDYLYEDTYIGRNERDGLAAQQLSLREGGFRLATPYYAAPLGRSDNFLAALNIKTDLPLGKLPLRVFLDVVTFSDAKRLNPSGSGLLFEAGVELYAADFFTVSLPLLLSSDYSDYLKTVYGKDAFARRITFSLAFDRINWLKTVSGALKKVF